MAKPPVAPPEAGPPDPNRPPVRPKSETARQARLATALRDNLRRRKAQARARAAPPPKADDP